MKIYKINCEWEMPVASGYFTTMELAQNAIEEEDWIDMVEMDLDEVLEGEWVNIEEIEVVEK